MKYLVEVQDPADLEMVAGALQAHATHIRQQAAASIDTLYPRPRAGDWLNELLQRGRQDVEAEADELDTLAAAMRAASPADVESAGDEPR
jgi:hypothetical protein